MTDWSDFWFKQMNGCLYRDGILIKLGKDTASYTLLSTVIVLAARGILLSSLHSMADNS